MNQREIWDTIPQAAKTNIIKSYNTQFEENISIKPSFLENIFSKKSINDQTLNKLFSINQLMLGGTNIDDISWITYFQNTKKIYLWGTSISDLSPLKELINLDEIYASGVQTLSYKPISKLKLKLLYNSSSQANDFQYLSTMYYLEKLELNDSNLDKVDYFSDLFNLKMLHLLNTEITTLRPLINLTKLNEVNCFGTNISDDELEYFNTSNCSGVVAENWI